MEQIRGDGQDRRQDGLQGTGEGLKVKKCRAGQYCNGRRGGGLLSKMETGNANRSDRTGQEGRNRQERIDRKSEKIQSS
jgi:hypothetical protein